MAPTHKKKSVHEDEANAFQKLRTISNRLEFLLALPRVKPRRELEHSYQAKLNKFGSMFSSSVGTLLSMSRPDHLFDSSHCCVLLSVRNGYVCQLHHVVAELFPEQGLLLGWPQNGVRLGGPSIGDWLDCCARPYVCDPLVANFGLICVEAWSLSISASSSRFYISDASFSSCCFTVSRL